MPAYPQHAATLPASLGGQTNGKLPSSLLVKPGFPGRPLATLHTLASRAATAMAADVLAHFGEVLTVTSTPDAYRSYAVQEATFRNRYTTTPIPGRPTKRWNGQTWYQKPGTAMSATPGTSNHGWGLAIDACWYRDNQVVTILANMPAFNWLLLNAFRFGFSWESDAEPWHLRYWAGDAVPAAVLAYEAPGPPPPPPPPDPTPPPPKGVTVINVAGPKRVLQASDRAALNADPEGRSDVQLCQIVCNGLLGAGLAIDGDYGPHTQAAATQYQAFSGLTADGQWGPKTWGVVLNLV